MTRNHSNIFVLADYGQSGEPLRIEDVKDFLDAKREIIRMFDEETNKQCRLQHKLVDIESYKGLALEHEHSLLSAFDWLEDKIAKTNGTEKEASEKLLKECERLIARNERIKKNINDDLAACRYHENRRTLDPVKIVGFAVGTPLSLVNLVKTFAPARQDLILAAGLGGAAIGTCLAFHHQAGQMLAQARQAITSSPHQARKMGKSVRNAFVAAAFTTLVAKKKSGNIRLLCLPQTPRHRLITDAAKMG